VEIPQPVSCLVNSPTPLHVAHMRYNSTMHPNDPAARDSAPGPGKFSLVLAGLCAILAASLLVYLVWFRSPAAARNYLLSLMPDDAQAVLFVDLNDLRRAPVFADLLARAPKPEADPEYRQFIRDTGFDYEKDLSAVAVAFEKQGPQQTFFAVADGRFDQKKIKAYAAKNGSPQHSGAVEIFSVPMSAAASPLNFAFLRGGRIAVSNRQDFSSFLQTALSSTKTAESADWRARFERVAGSSIFCVIRGEALKEYFGASRAPQNAASRAAGGLSSPQLSSLLAHLQWLTLAGKPENDKLKVVADGESLDDANAKQLADLLNGVALLARAGLSSAKNQQQIGAPTRQSYLALLKSVEVSRVDRGETKSVRLMFDVTPALLKLAPTSVSAPSPVSK
jgi:hypothetical protein